MGKSSWLAALPLALAAGSAIAGSSVGDMFSYSGFGTAGVLHTNTSDAEYVQTGQTSGATNGFDFKTDSKLGLQGTVTPTPWLSGTVQALAEERFDDSLAPKIEWAFIKLKPVSGVSVRAGQMALPSFLVSDSRNVGYANTWLRAPDEVYGQSTFDVYTGADVTYAHSIGSYTVTLDALAGHTKADYLLGPDYVAVINGHKLSGYSASVDAGVATLRYSYVRTNIDADIDGFTAARLVYTFTSIGATYDRNDVLLQSEFIAKHTQLTAYDVNGWYVLGGYRLGKWLPYGIYAAGQTPTGPNPPGPPLPNESKHTISAGVRADLIKSVDFKLQIDRESTYPNGSPFINIQPGFEGKAFVYSFAIDFVF
ncbi:MAG TPA: hypothetical protein VKG63_12240 [Steroidobacteraceae bacterium]|nr:hypothetical protein [Steroidobacteraceae bacterium]